MKGIIYKATNLLNGKVYIGQTTQTLERRAAGHKAQARKPGASDPFHEAIRTHGWDSFSWEIIEVIERDIPTSLRGAEAYIIRPVLLAAEARYINEYKSSDPRYGYNSVGGKKPSERRLSQLTNRRTIVTVYQIHRGRRYKTYPTFGAAREDIGTGPLYGKVINYSPEIITFVCPRCVTCVAIRLPEGMRPPLNIKIKAIRPETAAMRKKRKLYESPWMMKKSEERKRRLIERLNRQDFQDSQKR